MKAVNLRELKNRLGGYVKEVRAGEVILVTDRGVVVAELRPSRYEARAGSELESSLERLARDGKVRLGRANSASAYAAPPQLGVSTELITRLLDESRSES